MKSVADELRDRRAQLVKERTVSGYSRDDRAWGRVAGQLEAIDWFAEMLGVDLFEEKKS